VFGDSLSAAYGIAAKRGWVVLLGERLRREHRDYSVVNASVSGETTAGGLARLPRALERERPAILILELGANDGLRGLPIADMERNLQAMIALGRKAGAKVLLVGMRIPPNYGPDYVGGFADAFPRVAKREGVALAPFLLAGIADDLANFQSDRIHPTAAAQPVLLDNVWRGLAPLLK
jgi:acyl-CoA thioesterase-1